MAAEVFPRDRNEKTPLLMIADGGWDPYHVLEEAQSAFARAGEAMALAVDWFDRSLRRTRSPPSPRRPPTSRSPP